LEFPFEETDGLEPGNENEGVVADATDGLNVSEAGRNVAGGQRYEWRKAKEPAGCRRYKGNGEENEVAMIVKH
jgi:hypothetical protein